MLVFREEGMGQYRQCIGSMLSVGVCMKKIIDSTGLFECELLGKWFLGKVDDGFQSLATYGIQQVYCLLKSEYKVGLPIVLWLQSVMLVPGWSVVQVFWVNGVFCCFNGATAVLSVRSPAPV